MKEKNKERLNLSVDSETKKYLKIKAIEEGTNVSELIERMVDSDRGVQDALVESKGLKKAFIKPEEK